MKVKDKREKMAYRAPVPALGSAAQALLYFLGLCSRSKRWFECLQDVVLGPGAAEKGGCSLGRPD